MDGTPALVYVPPVAIVVPEAFLEFQLPAGIRSDAGFVCLDGEGREWVLVSTAGGEPLHVALAPKPGIVVHCGPLKRTDRRLAMQEVVKVCADRLADSSDPLLPSVLSLQLLPVESQAGRLAHLWTNAASVQGGQCVGALGQLMPDIIAEYDGPDKDLPPFCDYIRQEGFDPEAPVPSKYAATVETRRRAAELLAAIAEEWAEALEKQQQPIPRGEHVTVTTVGDWFIVVGELPLDPGNYLVYDVISDRCAVTPRWAMQRCERHPDSGDDDEVLFSEALAASPLLAASALQGHEASDDTVACTILAGQATLYAYLSWRQHHNAAIRIFKMLLATFKAHEHDDVRAKVRACLPELVNQKRRPRGHANPHTARTAQELMNLLQELEVYLLARHDFEHQDYSRHKDEFEEVLLMDDLGGEEAQVAPPAEPPPPERRPRPATPPKPRPLRGPATNHELLALEWPLHEAADGFAAAKRSVLDWLSCKLGTQLPHGWADGIHEIELGSVRLQVVAGSSVFAMRLEHPDHEFSLRTWRVECTLVQGTTAGGMAGVRVRVQDRAGEDLPAPRRSIPGLVRELRKSPGLQVAPGIAAIQHADTEAKAFELRNAIRDTARAYPLWVVSSVDVEAFGELPTLAALWTVADRRVLPSNVAAPVPGALWHVYAPGEDRPRAVGVDRIREEVTSAIEHAATQFANGPDFRDVLDFYREALARTGKRRPTEPEANLVPLPRGAADLQQQLDAAIGEADVLRQELAQSRREVRTLRGKLHQLSLATRTRAADHAADPISAAYPKSLESIADWVTSLERRVVVAEKALKHAARVDHAECERVYAALAALHDLYWEMRWGDQPDARRRWEEFLLQSRIRCGPIGTATDDRRYAADYQALFGQRKVEMTLHLQGSSSRDPRRCLRVYFHPCDDTRRVLVGHLPTHLTSTLT